MTAMLPVLATGIVVAVTMMFRRTSMARAVRVVNLGLAAALALGLWATRGAGTAQLTTWMGTVAVAWIVAMAILALAVLATWHRARRG